MGKRTGAMPVSDTFKKIESDKQRKVLDTAVEEFAQHGFRQASMNRIVRKLSIAKGSLFQYFGNKDGLFGFIFDHAVDLVRQSLRQVKQETESDSFFERIRRSLLAGVGFINRHPRIYQIYLKMIFQEDFPLRAEFLQQVHLFSAEYLRPLVKTGIERGEIRPDVDVDTTVFMLDALMDRFLQAYSVSFLDAGAGIYQASEDRVARKVDELVQLLRLGLGARGRGMG